jgi:hypothetical protein
MTKAPGSRERVILGCLENPENGEAKPGLAYLIYGIGSFLLSFSIAPYVSGLRFTISRHPVPLADHNMTIQKMARTFLFNVVVFA